MSVHTAVVEWTRDGDFLAGHYSRGHTLRFDGGVSIAASASPSVVRAPWSVEAAVDPEEMFVASLSSCHMLWFLDLARHAGIVVEAYVDEAEGVMGRLERGKMAVTRVVLRPRLTLAAPADEALIAELHHKAHEACFIANSVKTEIVVEPQAA